MEILITLIFNLRIDSACGSRLYSRVMARCEGQRLMDPYIWISKCGAENKLCLFKFRGEVFCLTVVNLSPCFARELYSRTFCVLLIVHPFLMGAA